MKRTRGRAFASGALRAGPAWLALIVALLVAAVGATWVWINGTAGAVPLPGRLHLRRGLHGRPEAAHLDEHRVRRPGRQLRRAYRRRRGRPCHRHLPMLLALVLFLWTPPHFWSLAIANRDDYAAAGVPMLPVVFGVERAARIVHLATVALVAASLLPVAFGAGCGLPRRCGGGRRALPAPHAGPGARARSAEPPWRFLRVDGAAVGAGGRGCGRCHAALIDRR
jgi:protoheme IX farnesyltransferase